MDHPLDDCRLKIARAKQQFDALRDEIADYFKGNPYVATIGVDPQSGDQVFEAAEPPRFKRSWGVIVGEIAHNCRSALDWLIHVLITESGGEPHGKTAFPISETEDGYFRVVRRGGITYRDWLLDGLSDSLKERIDAFQPYKRGDLAYADALVALRYLTDRDKHRHLHPAYGWINMPSTAFLLRADTDVRNIKLRLPAKGGVEMQADFKGGGRGADPGIVFYPKVQVKRNPGVEVVFGSEPDKMHGLDDLRQLIGYVETIIESFSRDLDRR
jgi:hypothetical protein